MIRKIIPIFVFLIALSGISGSAHALFDCYYNASGACSSDEGIVLWLNNTQGGDLSVNESLEPYFGWALCCKYIDDCEVKDASCTGQDECLFKVNRTYTSTPAEECDYSPAVYSKYLCCTSTIEDLDCTISPTCDAASGYEDMNVSLNKGTNSHVAQSGTLHYDNKTCCKLNDITAPNVNCLSGPISVISPDSGGNGGEQIVFNYSAIDRVSDIVSVKVCDSPDCSGTIFCADNDPIPPNMALIPVERSCTYDPLPCEHLSGEYYILAEDASGNTSVTEGCGLLQIIPHSSCACTIDDDCPSGYRCVDGKCMLYEAPNLWFPESSVTLILGTNNEISLHVKNMLATDDTIRLSLGGDKIALWSSFMNMNKDIEIELNGNQEVVVPIKVFAGALGTYTLSVFGESLDHPDLYRSRDLTVNIVNDDSGLTSKSPGMNWASFIILLISALVFI